jgi:hypothetical protein
VIGLVTPLCERVEPGAVQVATWFTMGELPTEAGGETDGRPADRRRPRGRGRQVAAATATVARGQQGEREQGRDPDGAAQRWAGHGGVLRFLRVSDRSGF